LVKSDAEEIRVGLLPTAPWHNTQAASMEGLKPVLKKWTVRFIKYVGTDLDDEVGANSENPRIVGCVMDLA
jgi:hypothetical protein